MHLRRFLLLVSLVWLGSCLPLSNPPLRITRTPFQPVPPTATVWHPAVEGNPTAVDTPAPELTIDRWWGLDFSIESQAMHLAVNPGSSSEIEISFRAGWPCEYINHRACAAIYTARGAPVMLVTAHSGLGGDAEALRYHLEGMGINRAARSLDEIQHNLADLRGLPVALGQGENEISHLQVKAALRVPPALLERYFELPVSDAMNLAADLDADFAAALSEPLVIIETCGWRHPDEAWLPGLSDTSASIYLIAIAQE